MKQLTNIERLEVAISLLDERQVDEYAERCRKRELGCPDGLCGACLDDKHMNKSTENAESRQIRALAANIDTEFIVTLPTLPPDKWLDDTIEKGWVDVNLATLLSYIADMVE